jgi:hypothetical protein
VEGTVQDMVQDKALDMAQDKAHKDIVKEAWTEEAV